MGLLQRLGLLQILLPGLLGAPAWGQPSPPPTYHEEHKGRWQHGQACGAGHGHALFSSLLISGESPSEETHVKHVTISENYLISWLYPSRSILYTSCNIHGISFNSANARHFVQ